MGLHQYTALQEEWLLRPPTNRLVAAFVGYEAPKPDEHVIPDDGSIDGLEEFARAMGMPIFRG